MASPIAAALHERYVPKGLRAKTGPLERHEARMRKKWKRRAEQDKPMGARIKKKTVYRVKAADARGRNVFFKTRTKMPVSTIRRLLARGNLKEQRINI